MLLHGSGQMKTIWTTSQLTVTVQGNPANWPCCKAWIHPNRVQIKAAHKARYHCRHIVSRSYHWQSETMNALKLAVAILEGLKVRDTTFPVKRVWKTMVLWVLNLRVSNDLSLYRQYNMGKNTQRTTSLLFNWLKEIVSTKTKGTTRKACFSDKHYRLSILWGMWIHGGISKFVNGYPSHDVSWDGILLCRIVCVFFLKF